MIKSNYHGTDAIGSRVIILYSGSTLNTYSLLSNSIISIQKDVANYNIIVSKCLTLIPSLSCSGCHCICTIDFAISLLWSANDSLSAKGTWMIDPGYLVKEIKRGSEFDLLTMHLVFLFSLLCSFLLSTSNHHSLCLIMSVIYVW